MKYVVANWKMNLSVRESIALTRSVLRAVQGHEQFPGIVLCPSFTALQEVHKLLTRTRVKLGAQNAGPDRSGAYTGEAGIAQLEDVGCAYAIIGHSERRHQFGEDDELVRRRLEAVLTSELVPIVCVGEPKEVRDSGKEQAYVLKQLKSAFADLKIPRSKQVFIAYEPVWAIGSGNPATPQQAVQMHAVIREYMANEFKVAGERMMVLYGGSTDGKNAYQFLRESEIDGLLVGGASIKANEFTKVLDAACEVMEAQESV